MSGRKPLNWPVRPAQAQSQPENPKRPTTFHSSHHRWQATRIPGRSQYALTPAWSAYSLPDTQTEQVPAEFADKYFLRRLLGKGSFGTVMSAVDKLTGLEWAVKIMPKKLEGKDPERILQRIREEVSKPVRDHRKQHNVRSCRTAVC